MDTGNNYYCADLNVNVTGKSRDKPTSLSRFYFQPRVIGLYYSLANRKKKTEKKHGFRYRLTLWECAKLIWKLPFTRPEIFLFKSPELNKQSTT